MDEENFAIEKKSKKNIWGGGEWSLQDGQGKAHLGPYTDHQIYFTSQDMTPKESTGYIMFFGYMTCGILGIP